MKCQGKPIGPHHNSIQSQPIYSQCACGAAGLCLGELQASVPGRSSQLQAAQPYCRLCLLLTHSRVPYLPMAVNSRSAG